MPAPTDQCLSVTDARAAALLVDPAKRRYFEPFLGRERTVTEAARELGVPPNSMLYRVRRMVELGLLSIVREQPRAGRAMRVYRSVADRMFVPYFTSPAVDLLEVLLSERVASEEIIQRALLREMREAHEEHEWGLLLYREQEGLYAYDAVQPGVAWHALGPDDPAVLDHAFTLPPLTHAQAKALQLELLRVLARHTREAQERSPTGIARPYLTRLVLAPQPDSDDEQ